MAFGQWPKYVPVSKQRANAAYALSKLEKKGLNIEPVAVNGRKIAHTFWGKAWCSHLEKFSDYENRLPRGRTYVRNGSVCHLAISKGKVNAIVSGSSLYNINIDIKPLSEKKWNVLQKQCAGQIGSLLELLQGRFSDNVMAIVTDPQNGLFPLSSEIKLACDCPDWAEMCKHIAAVLYGIGARLDHQPELLFLLRNVDHETLITAELDIASATTGQGKGRRLAATDLSDMFGIEVDTTAKPPPPKPVRKKAASHKKSRPKMIKKAVIKTVKKVVKTAVKKAIKKPVKTHVKTIVKTIAKTKKTAKTSKKPIPLTAAGIRRLREQLE